MKAKFNRLKTMESTPRSLQEIGAAVVKKLFLFGCKFYNRTRNATGGLMGLLVQSEPFQMSLPSLEPFRYHQPPNNFFQISTYKCRKLIIGKDDPRLIIICGGYWKRVTRQVCYYKNERQQHHKVKWKKWPNTKCLMQREVQ